MLKFIFDLFSKTAWYDGFIFTEGKSYNVLQYFGLMFVIAAAAYILGSINPAVIISKLMYGAGMTNMMRNYGKGPAALTLFSDMLKTLLAMTVGTSLCGITGAYVAGLFAVIGHVLPIFYGFKGGKGVASSAMLILYLSPKVFLIVFLLFVLIVWGTKYLSLASVICILLFPLLLYRSDLVPVDRGIRLIITLIVAGIVFFKHRTNVSRIMNGTESKFSFKKTQKRPTVAEIEAAEEEENDTEETDGQN